MGGEVGGGGASGKANLNATPATVNLGTVDVGTTSTAQTVTITNTGVASTVTVTPSGVGISASGCGGTLAAGGNCVVSITATPTAIGPIVGSVAVASANGNAVSISVTGVAQQPGAFTVTPTAINLGDVAVGSAVTASVSVSSTVALTGLTTGVTGPDLKLDPSSTCTASLAASTPCKVTVVFNSATAGTPVGDAIVVSQGGVTKTIPVTANVLAPAKLAATPTTASLTAIPGSSSSNLDINVGNIGGITTGQITVALAGTNAADFSIVSDKCSIVTLAAGAYCTVTVKYNPAATVTAAEAATLTITDKGTGASSVAVALAGTPNASTLSITPATGALGSVAPGASGAEVVFTVANSATGTPTGALAVTVNSALVTVSSNTCATKATLAAGDSCTVGVKLTPAAGTTAQAVSGLLTVKGASAGLVSASLTGAVVSSATLTATPTSVNFGSIPQNQQSLAQTVTIKNIGATATGTLAVTPAGTGAAQVAVTANTCTGTLAPAATCTFAVQYSPTDSTGVNGSITVSDGLASVSVPMVGTGLAPSALTLSSGSGAFGTYAIGYTGGPNALVVTPSTSATTDSGALTTKITGDNAADFAVSTDKTVSTCSALATLIQGQSCQFGVTFTPTGTGARTATLTISGAKGGVYQVLLTGTGTPLVDLVPMTTTYSSKTVDGLNFGQEPNGTAGRVYRYRAIVRGSSTVTATSTVATISLGTTTPPDFLYVTAEGNLLTDSPCNGATLGLTANTGVATTTTSGAWTTLSGEITAGNVWACDFYIQFYPQTGKSDTAKTATLTASASGSGNAKQTLTGLSTGPLVFDPATYGFQNINIGNASASNGSTSTTLTVGGTGEIASLTLVNKGAAGVNQGPFTVSLGGTNAADFGIVTDGCSGKSVSLTPNTATSGYSAGSYCVIEVVFVPGTVGTKTATLTATAASGETASTTLTGTVVQPTSGITVSPTGTADAPVAVFGSVAQTVAGTWQTFTIANPSTGTLTGKIEYSLTGPFELYTLATAGVGAYPTGYCGDSGNKQLAAGENCIIQVRFKPVNTASVTDTANNNGRLYVSNAGVAVTTTDSLGYIPLKGTATAQLVLSPTALDFGNVATNTAAVASTTITNVGTTALTLTIPNINSTGNPAPVAIATGSGCSASQVLAAGASCRLDYQYTGGSPTTGTRDTALSDGADPLTITILTDKSVSASLTVTGRSVNPAMLALYGFGDYSASSPIGFGNATVSGTSGIIRVWFTNTGDVAATGIAASLTQTGSEFAIASETGTTCNSLPNNTLAAGATCSVPVQLAPTTSSLGGSDKTAALTLKGAGLNTVTVNLSGRGHAATEAGVFADLVTSANTTVATIGSTAVNATAKVYYVLHNNSGGSISFADLAIAGDTADFGTVPTAEATGTGTACGTTIAAGATCQFAVTFAPTDYGNTTTNARRYRWATVAYQESQIAAVIGQVQKPAQLQLSAASASPITVTTSTATDTTSTVDFGQILEQASASLVFTVTNVGETTSGAVTPKLTTSDFSTADTDTYAKITATTCAAGLPSLGTCTVTVSVSGTVGSHTTSYLLASSAVASESSTAGTDAGAYQLKVNVVQAAYLTLTPASGTATAFGSVQAGIPASPDITITVHNGAGTDSAATRQNSGVLAVSLSNGNDFSVVNGSSSCYNTTTKAWKTVVGGATCTVVVRFTPASAGDKTTTLSVGATPGGATQTVTLTGSGLSDLTISPAGTSAAPTNVTTTQVFTVTNQGTAATSLLRSAVVGTNKSVFVITNDSCYGQSLAVGDSCTVTVTFVGTATATAQTASLTVNDGSANYSATAYLEALSS